MEDPCKCFSCMCDRKVNIHTKNKKEKHPAMCKTTKKQPLYLTSNLLHNLERTPWKGICPMMNSFRENLKENSRVTGSYSFQARNSAGPLVLADTKSKTVLANFVSLNVNKVPTD